MYTLSTEKHTSTKLRQSSFLGERADVHGQIVMGSKNNNDRHNNDEVDDDDVDDDGGEGGCGGGVTGSGSGGC